ncbi:DUF1850 domain-containing protein [Streptomonospora alba]|uniref:DUF1850 domain-containing protein n=1 Tax=Streptomonospora alba TaxID=183763 RepID=UPI001EE74C10|nr:DUF1850 domain-containing protein [Streptomonospora alba]
MLARRRALRAGGGLLAVGLLGGLAAAAQPGGRRLRFVAADAGSGRVVLSVPVAAGERVTLRYTHSVSKRPVEEEFSISATGGLLMQEMRFDTFGANLPAGPEHIGSTTTTFLRERDGYRVLHHGRPLGDVQLMVNSSRSGQVLLLPGGERVRLLDVADYGTRVELSVRGGPRAWP